MSQRATPPLSTLPGQVTDEAAAQMAGGSRDKDQASDPGSLRSTLIEPDRPSTGTVIHGSLGSDGASNRPFSMDLGNSKDKPREIAKAADADSKLSTAGWIASSFGGAAKDVKKDLDKTPSKALDTTAKVVAGATIDVAKAAAKEAGTYHEKKVEDQGNYKAAKTIEEKGGAKVETTKGFYNHGATTKVLYTVDSDTLKAAGASIQYEKEIGWQERTKVTVDRYGVKSTVTEIWTDGKFEFKGSATADANTRGVAIANASVHIGVSAEHGASVTVTDKDTGISCTRTGALKAEASADAAATGTLHWTKSNLKLAAAVEAALSARGQLSTSDAAGNAIGAGAMAKLAAGADGEAKAGYTFNPVDGYGVKTGYETGVLLGAKLGLDGKLATDVTKVEAAANGVFGALTGKFSLDGGYKDGKVNLKLEIGGALGVGYEVKIDSQIDLKRWADNVAYRADKIVNIHEKMTFWEKALIIADVGARGLPGLLTHVLFGESRPPPETLKVWFDPAKATKAEAFWHYVQILNEFGRKTIGTRGEGPLDRFEHPAMLSAQIAKHFGESKNPAIKALELTFNHQLPYLSWTNRPDPNDPKKSVPDVTQDGYTIFSGQLSLIQYLSLAEHKKVSVMDHREAHDYLRTDVYGHLTKEAKEKLWTFWEKLYGHKPKNPYNEMKQGLEWQLWKLDWAASARPEEPRIYGIERQSQAIAKASGVADNKLAPTTAHGDAELYKWVGVPRASDGLHLIDLTAVKQGKIGLKDFLFQNEMATLAKLGSPQAVYQYMQGASHIAEGSKGHFMAVWMLKNDQGEWHHGTDADSVRAQKWWAEHKTDYWKRDDTRKYWLL